TARGVVRLTSLRSPAPRSSSATWLPLVTRAPPDAPGAPPGPLAAGGRSPREFSESGALPQRFGRAPHSLTRAWCLRGRWGGCCGGDLEAGDGWGSGGRYMPVAGYCPDRRGGGEYACAGVRDPRPRGGDRGAYRSA